MMGAITRFCGEDEAVLLAVEAGCDIVLYPLDPERAIDALVKAVESGRLTEERIDRSCERLRFLKLRVPSDWGFRNASLQESGVGVAKRIAEAAITLVHGEPPRGPFSVVRVADASARGDLTVFEKALETKEDAETCVVAVFFKQKAFTGKTGLDEALKERVLAARRACRRLVVVSFGSPYVVRDLPPADTYICAYSEDPASQRAAARALRGEIPFRGKLPVTLDGAPQ
jgi:beta-N-acetylhexosaminidase